MRHSVHVASSVLSSTASLWGGTGTTRRARRQPEQPLVLYEFEACPYCRLVREALTELDLDAIIRPCPKGGKRFRPMAATLGGKTQFPFLHDPNTGARLYESQDIIDYLARTYDGRAQNSHGVRRTLKLGASMAASALRPLKGLRARPSREPEKPLELFSFESSPYSRLVREVLSELELPYLLHNTGKARWSDMGPPVMRDKLFKGQPDTGRNRKLLYDRANHVQLPYLVDPNTGTEMFESADIIDYLRRTYAN